MHEGMLHERHEALTASCPGTHAMHGARDRLAAHTRLCCDQFSPLAAANLECSVHEGPVVV